MHDQRFRRQVVVGWALIGTFALLAAFVERAEQLRLFQAAWVLGFVGYGLVLAGVWRLSADRVPGRWHAWLLGFAILRLVLLPATPSDDLHRYMWEGRIQRAGFNPYTAPPIDPRLRALSEGDPNHPRINLPDYASVYPPVAQYTFRLLSYAGNSVYIAKTFFVALDLAAVILLGRLLSALKQPPYRTAIYALCPLVLASFGMEGHLDSLMLVLTVAAVLLAQRRRWYLGGALLGLAIASKLVCVVLWPWLLWKKPKAAVLAVLVAAVTYLPYADAGGRVFDSVRRFGSGTGDLGMVMALLERGGGLSPQLARWSAGAALVAFAAYLLWRRAGLAVYATRMLAGLALILPSIHFWYLTWFLAFAWSRPRVSWLILAGTMGIYFEAQHNHALEGLWRMPAWAGPVMFSLFAAAWTIEEWCRHRGGSRALRDPRSEETARPVDQDAQPDRPQADN